MKLNSGLVRLVMSNFDNYVYFQEGPGLTSNLFAESGFPFINIRCIENNKLNKKNVQFISDKIANTIYKHFKIESGDILLSTSGSLGKKVKIKNQDLPLMLNTSIMRFRSKNTNDLINEYLFYYLESRHLLKQVEKEAQGSAQVNLGPTHFKKFDIYLPNLPTQKRIAKILSTVDGQIEKTDAIIAKYQAIKQGMLHDLFTRGIDLATGKLRPTPEQAPELYKSSPLGLIPKDWDVDKLATCCNSNGTYGINAAAVDYSNELPTYLRITDISENGKFINVDKKSVNHSLSSNYILSSGDIVFARTGASVGKTYLYNPDDGELIYAGFLIKFSPNIEKILPKFLKLITELSYYQNWVIKASMRSGQPGINGQEYGGFEIQLPNIEEQALICTKIDSLENLYNSESKKLTKLQKIKHGLMSKLLNGDV